MKDLNWGWLALGAFLGIGLVFFVVYKLGRAFFKRVSLEDRGDWDRPLPEPFEKNQVIAVYKRRRRYHRHHRHAYDGHHDQHRHKF